MHDKHVIRESRNAERRMKPVRQRQPVSQTRGLVNDLVTLAVAGAVINTLRR